MFERIMPIVRSRKAISGFDANKKISKNKEMFIVLAFDVDMYLKKLLDFLNSIL